MNLDKSLSLTVRYFLIEIESIYDFTESIVKFINEKHSFPNLEIKDKRSVWLKFWRDFSEKVLRDESSLFFKMVLMSLFALFEAFNKSFFTILLSAKPICLKSKKKTLTYEEIIGFKSLEELHEFLALKATDEFGRNSIEYISKFIKNNFKIDIASDFEYWEELRENYYRRNIVVHNRSKVSNDFINKINGYDPADLGKELEINYSYIKQCHNHIWSYIEMIFGAIVTKFNLKVIPEKVLDTNYPEDLLFNNSEI